VIPTWQYLNADYVIHEPIFFPSILYLASPKSLSFVLYLEEPNESICKRGDHVWLKLMHCDCHAFLLGDDELENKLGVVHVPDFDHTVLASCGYRVVLVKLVQRRVDLILGRG